MLRQLSTLHFLNDGIRTGYVALLPFIAKDISLSFTGIGFLGSSQGLLTSVLAFPAGFLASRFGTFRIMLFSLLIYSLASLGLGVSVNALLVTIFFYLGACGFGMFHTMGYTLVARISEKTNIGKNMGNFTAVGDIGRILIPASAIFLAAYIGWHYIFISIGMIGISLFAILQMRSHFRESTSQLQKTHEPYKEWTRNLLVIFRQKKLLLILSAAIIDNLAGNPIYIFLPFLLLAKGISPVFLAIFTVAYFVGSLSGKSILGRGVDKYGNVKIFVVAELCMAVLLIVLVLLSHFYLLLIVAFLLGLFTRGTTPVMSTLFSELTHERHFEKVFGISEVFLGIAAALAPAFMGIIADSFGINAVFFAAAFLAIMATTPIIFLQKKQLADDAIRLDTESGI